MITPIPDTISVQELRTNGYKTRISHFRRVKRCSAYFSRAEIAKDSTLFEDLSHFGGKTVAEVRDHFGNEWVGESICCEKDNFCFSRGLRISLGRAVSKMNKSILE